jgi:hypothetical protein
MPAIVCKKCSKKAKSLQGWKQHMTGAHGGYTDAELEEIAGGKSEDDLQARMSNLASTLGESAEAKVDEPTPRTELPPQPPEGKRVKATPKKLKKILGDIPAQILRAQGIELDSDDTEAMEEAAEFLAGIFGIEFVVPESKTVIQSRFFALVWVAGVTMLVWVKHRTPQVWAMFSSDKAKDNVESNNRDSGTKG